MSASPLVVRRRPSWFGVPLRFARIVGETLAGTRAVHAYAGKPGERERTEARKIVWAQRMLAQVNVDVRCVGAPFHDAPSILVGNHVSVVDIPVVMAEASVGFVAKAEVGRWPIFGKAVIAVGTVLVERGRAESRRAAAEAIARTVEEERRTIMVFPAGTTSLEETKPWRWGTFTIAAERGIPVQPVAISYRPLRPAAFIDDDTFVGTLSRMMREPRVEAVLELGEPTPVVDPEADAERLRAWVRERHLARLAAWRTPLTDESRAWLDARRS
ncbi:MAG: lysophospholipid acyltransferase family protein [Myxococcota bacterium]